MGQKVQLTWTEIPHSFKRAPLFLTIIWGKKIGKLEKENLDKTLLQCVDYILPATKTESKCLDATVSLLNFLGQS